MRAALLLVALLSTPAFAADVGSELDAIHEMVDTLLRRSKALEDQLAPGTGYVDEKTAIRRYEDYVYMHLVGQHADAAEGFFALVTTGALGDSGMHRDAEWYLADSLYQMGNLTTAEARFQAIVDQPGHPFRDDAVRQILEIYAISGRNDDFTELYEREVLRGKVEATDVVLYSLGKSFHAQDQLDNARIQFLQIEPESPWYGRAQYYLGALDVTEGKLDEALPFFKAASEISVESTEDAQVRDLALLAGGRILFEQGRFADSAATYALISGESEYNADKLYEMTWAHIQQEKWKEALRAVEIFLIAYPEHAYTAQLKLVRGHLHVSKSEFDSALTAYERVLGEYGPIRDYFGQLSESEDPSVYLRQLTGEGEFETLRLPDFAVSKMLEDPDLARAVAILSEIHKQETDIEESERLIKELTPILANGDSLGGFEDMRYDAVLVANQAAEQSLLLLETEESWLLGELNGAAKDRVYPLQDRRLALIGQARDSAYRLEEAREALERHNLKVRSVRRDTSDVMDVASAHLEAILEIRALLADPNVKVTGKLKQIVEEDLAYLEGELIDAARQLEGLDTELANLKPPTDARRMIRTGKPVGDLLAEIEALRNDYSELRPGNRVVETSARVDTLHGSLNAVHDRLQRVAEGLSEVEASEMEVLRARFANEVAAVSSQRASLDDSLGSTRTVSMDLTRQGFGRLSDFFTESLLKADMGIVDVYWSQKLSTVDEIARVKEEKAALVEELERRFDLIEQKLAE